MTYYQLKKFSWIGFISASCLTIILALTGCQINRSIDQAMMPDSHLNQAPIELASHSTKYRYSLSDVSAKTILDNYNGGGHGPIELYLAVDKSGVDNSTRKQALRLVRILEEQSDHSVSLKIGRTDQVPDNNLIVSYNRHAARAGLGCPRLPGIAVSVPLEAAKDYQMGCERDHQLANMVANPDDLLGNDQLDKSSASRQSVVVDRYRSAEEPEELEVQTGANE
jgi:type IV pilus biogenesis protein CpaD/CtpE